MSEERVRISREAVSGLDAARSIVAIYVVVHHAILTRGIASSGLLRLGQEAVITFFVLSGVVIFLNEHSRMARLSRYFLRRVRRIYPPLLISFLISVAVSLDNGSLSGSFRWGDLLGNIFALQDVRALKPGVWVDPFLGNSPLWSLSYEMAFYAIFPAIMILWRISRRGASHFVGAASCVAYVFYVIWPNHLSLVVSYFQIWWLGAMAVWQASKGSASVSSIKAEIFWSLALCAVAAISVYMIGYSGIGEYPFLMVRHFSVGTIIVIIFFGPIGIFLARSSAKFSKLWSYISSMSYGLYVFHYPLIVQWKRSQSTVGFAVGVILLLAAAWLFDRQLNRLLPKVSA